MKTLVPILAGMALAAAAGPAALAQASPPASAAEAAFRTTTLSLGAEGRTRLKPDQATITLGVVSEAPTAAAAMQAGAQRMTAVLASLRRSGVAAKDIQTSGVSLEPQYAYEQNQPPRLTGYRAANQVLVTVRDLSKLGQAADAAVGAGADQVNGIAFGLADPSPAEDAARQAAVRALQAKAELYARATGYRIVRLVSLSEAGAGGAMPPPPFPPVAMMARMEKAATPIAPGEVEVQVQVSGVFELAR